MAITITSNIQTEQQAVRTAADLIKNPPKDPIEMAKFIGKNFSASGELMATVGKMLGLGKAIPMIGAIFDVFASFTTPSVGEQIAQAVEQITSAINAAVDELKSAIDFATEKTISAVINEVQGISLEESA